MFLTISFLMLSFEPALSASASTASAGFLYHVIIAEAAVLFMMEPNTSSTRLHARAAVPLCGIHFSWLTQSVKMNWALSLRSCTKAAAHTAATATEVIGPAVSRRLPLPRKATRARKAPIPTPARAFRVTWTCFRACAHEGQLQKAGTTQDTPDHSTSSASQSSYHTAEVFLHVNFGTLSAEASSLYRRL